MTKGQPWPTSSANKCYSLLTQQWSGALSYGKYGSCIRGGGGGGGGTSSTVLACPIIVGIQTLITYTVIMLGVTLDQE